MYKKAFQSENWSSLHAHLPSFIEKKKPLSKRKRLEAQKYKQYLKEARKRVKQMERETKSATSNLFGK